MHTIANQFYIDSMIENAISLHIGKELNVIDNVRCNMETGTLSSKGQITIPKKIREILNVQTSDKLVFIPLENGKVLLTTEQKSAASIFGSLKHRMKKKPVSLEQMDEAVKKHRVKRNLK